MPKTFAHSEGKLRRSLHVADSIGVKPPHSRLYSSMLSGSFTISSCQSTATSELYGSS